MPNNNGKSYMQGNVSFTPMTGGKSIDIRYANYSTQDYMVPLDTVEPGAYFLYIFTFQELNKIVLITNLYTSLDLYSEFRNHLINRGNEKLPHYML